MQGEARWAPGAPAWAELFRAIDGRDAAAFASFIADDGEFRFGNAPAVVGRTAVRDYVAAFFGMIGGCSHRLHRTWQSPGTVACEGEVTYTRLDGGKVTVPFVNVFVLKGAEVASYRIYIDNSPLFSGS